MSSMTETTPNNSILGRSAALLGSLLLGFIGGFILLGSGWLLLTQTPLGTLLANTLGITAKTAWHVTRSTGMVAYLLLAASTIWGLLLSTKIIKDTVPPVLSLAMHNVLSWAAIGLVGVHMFALLFDSFYTYRLADLVIPFIGPYRPEWVGLGIIGMYLMLLTSLSFNWRKQLGQKWWRRLHYFTFIAFIMVTVHGVMAGTDSSSLGMKTLYWGSGLLVLLLTNYRLLTAGHNGRSSHSSRPTRQRQTS
ncbi:MAG: ferric reductase-like transmembrane domain-containing protein [Anaerolineales bacterium]|nr:ferric reductase-like transmembrane domain-containing protein [Anaerolineales bacterium]